MKPSARRATGLEGEERAARHLEKLGYSIVARNFRARSGEIDLVAVGQGTLVFVEVRSRRRTGFGSAVESVTWKKRRRLLGAAREYLASHPAGGRVIRFDVIGIDGTGEASTLEHVENAFGAEG